MKTQRPLREMLTDIMQYVRMHTDYLQYNNRLMLVHEGQLRKEIEDSLRTELSDAAFKKAITRVPSINVLTRIIDKLSRVYSEPATRTPSESDKDVVRYYERKLDLANKLPSANRMLNLHKCCALEPYICDEGPALRVIPANQFLVYSDSPVDPLEPTVFIKLMGREQKAVPYTDVNGRKIETDQTRLVDIYYLYSDDEVLIVDSDGSVRDDKMTARGMDGSNPIGRIPFIYINRSEFRLVPLPDTDTLDNTILIPKLLSDLNYAVQFQSHSVVVATDMAMPAAVPWAPDVVLSLKTDEGSPQQGQVTTIKPEVDIEQVLKLIETTMSLWLEARNIKTSGGRMVTAESAASGVAKLIDESDASQDRRAQMILFERAESELWKLMAIMHEYWLAAYPDLLEEKRSFSDKFSVAVVFANMQPAKSEQDEVETVGTLLDKRLIDKPMALRRLYPHMTPAEIEDLLSKTEETQVVLTGAQLDSLIKLVTAVAMKQVPRDAGVAIIQQAFSMTEETANSMLGSAGGSFNAAAQQGPGATGSGNSGPGQEGGDGGSSGKTPANDPGADAGGIGSEEPGSK